MEGGKQTLVLQQYWLSPVSIECNHTVGDTTGIVQEKFAMSSNQTYNEQLCHYLELFHEVMEVNFLLPSALTTSITENWRFNLVLPIPPL